MARARLCLPTAGEGRLAWRRRLGVAEDAVVACMSAHLHAFKDHATLLRAWRIMLDGATGQATPTLVLAGRPAGAEDSLKALAFDLELGGSVIFAGEIADVGGLLAASDIGVLSSRRESWPRAVLEYMAAGLPVVGTDIPGIREIMGEEGGRFLAPPDDAEGLAAALLELVTNPEIRWAAGSENERLARERLAASPFPEETGALVADALERARRR
jgi:glycosyltransferase involved in cell wall biosynthesis